MSKKILKRSLALGALMAFVITGQAWAMERNITLNGEDVTYDNQINSTDSLKCTVLTPSPTPTSRIDQ